MSPLVRIDAVSKHYSGRPVLNGVSLDLHPQAIVGLIGANGAGKTTLLRILVGLLGPDDGTVLIDGTAPPGAFRRVRVGYFAGESTLPPRVRVASWQRFWGAEPEADSRRMAVLSRGSRQLVGLRALLGSWPRDLIVLDEPWEGLDPDGARWLSRTLLQHRDEGTAIVVSSHRLHDLADVCDRCECLAAGRLVPVAFRNGPARGAADSLYEAFDRIRGRRSGGGGAA